MNELIQKRCAPEIQKTSFIIILGGSLCVHCSAVSQAQEQSVFSSLSQCYCL